MNSALLSPYFNLESLGWGCPRFTAPKLAELKTSHVLGSDEGMCGHPQYVRSCVGGGRFGLITPWVCAGAGVIAATVTTTTMCGQHTLSIHQALVNFLQAVLLQYTSTSAKYMLHTLDTQHTHTFTHTHQTPGERREATTYAAQNHNHRQHGRLRWAALARRIAGLPAVCASAATRGTRGPRDSCFTQATRCVDLAPRPAPDRRLRQIDMSRSRRRRRYMRGPRGLP